MSLDIYLRESYPGGEPMHHCKSCTCLEVAGERLVFDANITHNLIKMWRAAGVYAALYESDEKLAADIVPALRAGITAMEAEPVKFRALDSPNGWGRYENALPWLKRLAEACDEYPTAKIGVSE